MSINRQTALKLRYEPGAARLVDLQSEIASAFQELNDPESAVARTASELGLASPELELTQTDVDQEGKGFGDVIIIITILAPVTNHILRNVWDEVIWPRVRSRLGADALGSESKTENDELDNSES